MASYDLSNKIEFGLFDGKYSPITDEIGFLECDAERASIAIRQWRDEIEHPSREDIQSAKERFGIDLKGRPETRIELTKRAGGLEDAIKDLLPLTSVERRREVILPTAGAWCAYLDNGVEGTDASSTIGHMTTVLSCRGVRERYYPHTLQEAVHLNLGKFGIVLFELFSGEKTDWINILRTVGVGFDGSKWEFISEGLNQEFELSENYKKGSIVDRFTFDMLKIYLGALGLNAFDESFYAPGGHYYLIEKIGLPYEGTEEFTVKAASNRFF